MPKFRFAFIVCALAFSLQLRAAGTNSPAAAETNSTQALDSAQIWKDLQQSFLQIDPPKSWLTNHPSEKAMADWKVRKAQIALQLADQARDYYRAFPDVPQAKRARESEYNLLEIVVASGNTNSLPRLTNLDNQKLAAARTPADRFAIRAHVVKRDADWHMAEGVPAVMSYLETGSRELIKEFPENPDAWQFLVSVADQEQDLQKSRKLAQEILASNASEGLKSSARRIIGRLDHVGKPFPFRGVGLDGRPVDLADLKGRVVLLHFWETGCGYCVHELADVKAAYEKLHGKGLDVISFSFDSDRKALDRFLAMQPMPWPQIHAGPDWRAQHGNDFDVQAIPTVWLVDRHGNLRDLNARENLMADVEQLLNEK